MKRILSFLLFQFCTLFLIIAQPNIQLIEIASDFVKPVDITHTGDARLFIVEQRGRIQIINEQGERLSVAFLNIENKVGNSLGERGLLGLAFHPDYATNGFFYVNYTRTNGNTIIARFSRSTNDPNVADSNSEVVLLDIDQPFGNHNGGGIKFGADGYLYIGMGDGGSGGDPLNSGQDDNSLLGKMLRIDVDNGDPYAIPEDNPFIDTPTIRDEIWATGLRNPWRFSFDRETNDLWIADVGQNKWEEVSYQPSASLGGENYGWRCKEGFEDFSPNDCTTDESLTEPIHVYQTGGPDGASITGGFVYRGQASPALVGHYIYGDYVSQKIWSLTNTGPNEWTNQELMRSGLRISTFGEDHNGEIYVAAHSLGTIFQIMADPISPIEEIPSIDYFETTPNPFQKNLNIYFSKNTATPLQLTVHNWSGQRIFETTIKRDGQHHEVVNLKGHPKGIYYIELLEQGKRIVQKVVKQ